MVESVILILSISQTNEEIALNVVGVQNNLKQLILENYDCDDSDSLVSFHNSSMHNLHVSSAPVRS